MSEQSSHKRRSTSFPLLRMSSTAEPNAWGNLRARNQEIGLLEPALLYLSARPTREEKGHILVFAVSAPGVSLALCLAMNASAHRTRQKGRVSGQPRTTLTWDSLLALLHTGFGAPHLTHSIGTENCFALAATSATFRLRADSVVSAW